MSTQQFVEEPRKGGTERDKKMVAAAGAGAATEAIGAAAAIVLAIIGLSGAFPIALMSITTIVLGAAILLDAGSVGARYRRLMGEAMTGEEHRIHPEVGGGMSAESIAGIAGIVLGILALLGVAPRFLCSIALIAFGAGLLFGSAAKGRFASLSTERYGLATATRRIIDEALNVTAGGEVIVGIGAIVLGILALLRIQPVVLVLAGYLAVGATMLFSGSTIGARMFAIHRHST
jgi:hypothetical protein